MRKSLWLAVLCTAGLVACNQLLWFLPPLRDGRHYLQPMGWEQIQRGQSVAACLQQWARSNGWPAANYTDVNFGASAIVGVGDPGVAGPNDFVAARESNDTMYVDLRIISANTGEYIAIQRHEFYHEVAERHPEVEGPHHDLHYAPAMNACKIPLAIWVSL